jgi:hypothetical protein
MIIKRPFPRTARAHYPPRATGHPTPHWAADAPTLGARQRDPGRREPCARETVANESRARSRPARRRMQPSGPRGGASTLRGERRCQETVAPDVGVQGRRGRRDEGASVRPRVGAAPRRSPRSASACMVSFRNTPALAGVLNFMPFQLHGYLYTLAKICRSSDFSSTFHAYPYF